MTALKDMCQAIRTTITVSEDRGRDGKVPPASRGFEVLQNRADLQADEDEGQHVQHEDHRLPHGVGRYAYPRGVRSGAVRATVMA